MSVTHKVGTECFLDSVSPGSHYATVFEEDGTTGYFYAMDTSLAGQQIVNALHIYDVGHQLAAGDELVLSVVWSSDGMRAGLKSNGTMLAAFDFSSSTGWQRGTPKQRPGKWRNCAWDPKIDSWFL